MKYRKFGNTDLNLSEVGFGAWAIGGQSFGQVDRMDSLNALAKAEELGCNFVDTATVYGESENILGDFLKGRRDKWIVSSKYSGQKQGMTQLVNEQLKRMNLDAIDFYQIHWAPNDPSLYEELYALKASGKVRYIGVSLATALDIDYVADKTEIDGFQLDISLLTPYPFLRRLQKIREHNLGVIARSSLHFGFLTGKYTEAVSFDDKDDQRSQWSRDHIKTVANNSEAFRFLENENRSMAVAAACYPLSFPEVTTVIMSSKNAQQAQMNFGDVPQGQLSSNELVKIKSTQQSLGLFERSFKSKLKEQLSLLKMKLK